MIFPTLDRADRLRTALQSVCEQTIDLRRVEVLVVDNGSADETAAVAEAFASRIPRLIYVRELTPGLHAARHRGMRESRSDVLVFADDDIRALPSWLATICSCFAQRELAMLGGNNLPDFEAAVPDWLNRLWNKRREGGRWIDALSVIELSGDARSIDPCLVWGCNFSVRKQVLLEAGGFHPDAMPPALLKLRGDGETHVARFVKQHGMLCMFHPEASVYHCVSRERMAADYFRRRAYAQGISDSFTELRRQHLSETAGERGSATAALRGFLGRIADFVERGVQRDTELRSIELQRERAYREGYEYHQRCFAQDTQLRDWVLKPTYLES